MSFGKGSRYALVTKKLSIRFERTLGHNTLLDFDVLIQGICCTLAVINKRIFY